MLTLVIGNKNLSSWSLRPWLLLREAGIPFTEELVLFETPGWRDSIRALSPSGRVPALRHGEEIIGDSLAIAEYVAELHPEKMLWPADRLARAHARAVSAEMHAGFSSLRREMSMDVVARHPRAVPSAETEADIARIEAIWTECRRRWGRGGRFLFGAFGIADAMFAPVAFRFRTYDVALDGEPAEYCQTLLSLPGMKAWEADAEAEVRAARAAAAERPAGALPDPRSAQHCFAVIFSSQRTKTHGDEYASAAEAMVELAREQPGFLGFESARSADGFGISVSYWESLEAIRHWKDEARHRGVQALGKSSFYERYEVRVCNVERGYKFER